MLDFCTHLVSQFYFMKQNYNLLENNLFDTVQEVNQTLPQNYPF